MALHGSRAHNVALHGTQAAVEAARLAGAEIKAAFDAPKSVSHKGKVTSQGLSPLPRASCVSVMFK